MSERGEDASSGSLEGDGLTTEVDVVRVNVSIGEAGSIHSHGEPGEIRGTVMEEVRLAEGKGVAASATVPLRGKSR